MRELDDSNVYEYVKRLTDVHRLQLFDVVMQFRAIFSDDSSPQEAAAAAGAAPGTGDGGDAGAVYSWAQHRLCAPTPFHHSTLLCCALVLYSCCKAIGVSAFPAFPGLHIKVLSTCYDAICPRQDDSQQVVLLRHCPTAVSLYHKGRREASCMGVYRKQQGMIIGRAGRVFYLETLAAVLPRIGEGGSLASVLEHCMYCGMSLGRVGLDFRGLLVPLFEAQVLRLYANSVKVSVSPSLCFTVSSERCLEYRNSAGRFALQAMERIVYLWNRWYHFYQYMHIERKGVNSLRCYGGPIRILTLLNDLFWVSAGHYW